MNRFRHACAIILHWVMQCVKFYIVQCGHWWFSWCCCYCCCCCSWWRTLITDYNLQHMHKFDPVLRIHNTVFLHNWPGFLCTQIILSLYLNLHHSNLSSTKLWSLSPSRSLTHNAAQCVNLGSKISPMLK